eukprot:TRINITY_DN5351_c0_g2_i1.p1 TRINITY_DN5351_c0_g2~~TRINITY_DN5351_c0_g2_i1.p1  ORF type:complete len:396 (+),score=60.88 TRINITY_DN5351_c0_g2_i1:309-1496(+)
MFTLDYVGSAACSVSQQAGNTRLRQGHYAEAGHSPLGKVCLLPSKERHERRIASYEKGGWGPTKGFLRLANKGSAHGSASRPAQRARGVQAAASGVEYDILGEAIFEDYYSVLGLSPTATPEEVKRAYYGCMKACHPDLTGDNPESTAFCQFVNEIYEVLSDPEMRAVYDEINGYAITAINPFLDVRHSADFTFVDEFSCIGCKNCANTAGNTFEIEWDFGRARVCDQRGDHRSKIDEAIETCPVNCIHKVTAAQLSLLEDEMRRMERVSVGTMLAGMGSKGADVFGQAQWRWRKRQAKAQETTRVRMAKEKGKDANSQWAGFWTPAADTFVGEDGSGEAAGADASRVYNAEKMARAAAAARRWREYSRSGADRRPKRALAAASEERSESDLTPV